MSMLSKGEITQNKILLSAKTVFFNKGYKNATLSEISKKINVPVSLVSYYFKSKENLSTSIGDDIYYKTKEYVDNITDDKLSNFTKYYITYLYINYEFLRCDENIRFFNEISDEPFYKRKISLFMTNTYKDILDDLYIDYTDEELDEYYLLDTYIRLKLTMFYNKKDSIYVTKKMFRYFGRMITLNEHMIDKFEEEALNVFYSNKSSYNIKLLI